MGRLTAERITKQIRTGELMAENLVYKIIRSHLIDGEMTQGREITLSVDQTLAMI